MIEGKYKKYLIFDLAVLVFAVSCLILSGVLTYTVKIPSNAEVRTVGVAVYWDLPCTNETTKINWGLISPNETLTLTLYMLGTANVPVTLSMQTESWVPVNASYYLNLTWDLEGQILNPEQVLPAQLMLTCSANVTEITTFRFDILLSGSG